MTDESDIASSREGGVLLTDADLAAWQAAVRHYEAQIDVLRAKTEAARQRIDLALKLKALMGEHLDAGAETPTKPEPQTPPVAPVFREIPGGSWISTVRSWIYESPTGLTATELRQRIQANPDFAARFAQSDKGYYHAVNRLQKMGHVTRHKGVYYSPAAYADHMKRVETGEIEDLVRDEASPGYSPMGEAVLDLVAAKPGITGPEIIGMLRTDPEFADALAKHNTGGYNAIARLSRRGLIVRDEGKCYPGPNMTDRDPNSRWLSAATGRDPDNRGHLI